MILSLEGCMAVGKTTVLKYLKEHVPGLHVCLEDISPAVGTVTARNLKKTQYADYLEIQRIWISNELARFKQANRFPLSVLEYGPAEIEFYTLYYPFSIGKDWEIETALKPELAALRACKAHRILFLDANNDALISRKNNDTNRHRSFFDHTLHHLMPLKRQWFSQRDDTDFLNTSTLSVNETGREVLLWLKKQGPALQDL